MLCGIFDRRPTLHRRLDLWRLQRVGPVLITAGFFPVAREGAAARLVLPACHDVLPRLIIKRLGLGFGFESLSADCAHGSTCDLPRRREGRVGCHARRDKTSHGESCACGSRSILLEVAHGVVFFGEFLHAMNDFSCLAPPFRRSSRHLAQGRGGAKVCGKCR